MTPRSNRQITLCHLRQGTGREKSECNLVARGHDDHPTKLILGLIDEPNRLARALALDLGHPRETMERGVFVGGRIIPRSVADGKGFEQKPSKTSTHGAHALAEGIPFLSICLVDSVGPLEHLVVYEVGLQI